MLLFPYLSSTLSALRATAETFWWIAYTDSDETLVPLCPWHRHRRSSWLHLQKRMQYSNRVAEWSRKVVFYAIGPIEEYFIYATAPSYVRTPGEDQ